MGIIDWLLQKRRFKIEYTAKKKPSKMNQRKKKRLKINSTKDS